MTKKIIYTLGLLIALVALGQETEAQEKRKISRRQVPLPLQEAFQKRFPGASLKQAEVEEKEGKLIYSLEGKHKGIEVEIVYAVEIQLIEQQEDIPLSDLPAIVSAAIKTAHPNATVTEAEKITKDGILLGYEVELKDGSDSLELRLSPEGKILVRKVD